MNPHIPGNIKRPVNINAQVACGVRQVFVPQNCRQAARS